MLTSDTAIGFSHRSGLEDYAMLRRQPGKVPPCCLIIDLLAALNLALITPQKPVFKLSQAFSRFSRSLACLPPARRSLSDALLPSLLMCGPSEMRQP